MYGNILIPNLNLAALNALAANAGGMMTSPAATNASVASTAASQPVSTNTSTSTATTGSTASTGVSGASTTGTISAAQAANILSNLDLNAIAGASGMMGVPGATSSTITNPYTAAYVFNPDVSLVGATDIFGGRTYESPLATPDRTRVGYSEMLQLNQAPGYVATNRPEQIGDMYLPYRPSGEGAQVADDIKTWYEYYTDNEDFRKYLSADEQTELAWLDYRNDRYTQEAFTNKINDIRSQFNLPKKVGFEDFEAHFSYGTKRKKYSDNPYSDLQQYGPSIGGYWNPENDPSEFQQAMSNPLVGAVATAIGSAVGGPIGAALASGLTTRASGADWGDALTAAAMAGGSSYLGNVAGGASGAASGATGAAGGAAGSTGIGSTISSFMETAAGQGLARAGLSLARGGDLEDALIAGVLGYAGAPGGLLSGTLGETLGLDIGANTLATGLENLSLADALKFGLNVGDDQWSAVGDLFGDMDLGTLAESGLLSSLPGGVQNFLENVQVSDVLSNVGGLNTSSLLDILGDLNTPSLNINGANINVPNWLQNAYENVEGAVQNVYQNAEGAVQDVYQNVEGTAQDVYEALADALQNTGGLIPDELQALYENVEGAVQDAYQNTEGAVQTAYENVEGTVQDAYQNAEGAVQTAYEAVEEPVQNAYENVEGTVQDVYEAVEEPVQNAYENVEGAVQDAYQNAEGVVQNAYEAIEEPVQTAYENVEGAVQDVLDKDLVDINEAVEESIRNLSMPSFDINSLFSGLLGTGLMSQQRPRQNAASPEYNPYMATVSYDPRIQGLSKIVSRDPLSVLLQEFYKTRGIA